MEKKDWTPHQSGCSAYEPGECCAPVGTPITIEDIEAFAEELGGKPVADLREAAQQAELPHLFAKFRQLSPAMAEATLAHILFHLADRDHIDPERVFKLLRLAVAGNAAVFAEGGFFGETPKA